MPRSISTPPTLALARRRSMSLRMARSSWSSVAYSLSAYHFADQVRLVPRRKPYGWTLCPMSGLPFFEDDGDCLLYTSDAADDLLCVDLGGRRIIKKKKKK